MVQHLHGGLGEIGSEDDGHRRGERWGAFDPRTTSIARGFSLRNTSESDRLRQGFDPADQLPHQADVVVHPGSQGAAGGSSQPVACRPWRGRFHGEQRFEPGMQAGHGVVGMLEQVLDAGQLIEYTSR